MSKVKIEKTVNRKQLFAGIIREHNKLTGFTFILDELNSDDKYKYAHATHTDKIYKITCQMDIDSVDMYGLHLKFNDMPLSIDVDDTYTKKQLDSIIKSDAFKTRMGALKMFMELQKRIRDEIDILTVNIFRDSITETEKQDAYDTIMLTARKLLRD